MTANMDQFEDLFIILVRSLCHLHLSPDQALDLWDLRHSRARSRVHLPSGLTIFSVWPPSCDCLMVTKWLHHLPPWVSNSQGEIRKKKQGERKLPDQESKPFQKPPGKCFICPHQWAKEFYSWDGYLPTQSEDPVIRRREWGRHPHWCLCQVIIRFQRP